MHRLPVFATVGNAYRFLIRSFGHLGRLSWLPLILLAGLLYAAGPGDIISSATGEWPQRTVVAVIATSAVAFVVWCAIGVAVGRMVLFGESTVDPHLSIGGLELRFMAIPFVWAGGILAIAGAAMLVWVVFGIIATLTYRDSLLLLASPLLVVIFGFAVFVAVRMLVIHAVVVASGRLDFPHTWQVTRGNFWRLLGLSYVLVLSLVPIGTILIFASWGTTLLFNVVTIEDLRVNAWQILPFNIAINLGFGFVVTVISVATNCYCYKSLVGVAPHEPIQPSAFTMKVDGAQDAK